MQVQPVDNICQTKGLGAGLVVHHADELLTVLLQYIHPIHRPANAQAAAILEGDHPGMHRSVHINGQFKGLGLKIALGKLPCQTAHHIHQHFGQAAEVVTEAGGHIRRIAHFFLKILFNIAVHQRGNLLSVIVGQLLGAHLRQQFLQHIMDQRASLHRIDLRLLARLCPQPEFAEVAVGAVVIILNAGGGQHHILAKQFACSGSIFDHRCTVLRQRLHRRILRLVAEISTQRHKERIRAVIKAGHQFKGILRCIDQIQAVCRVPFFYIQIREQRLYAGDNGRRCVCPPGSGIGNKQPLPRGTHRLIGKIPLL